MKRLWIAALATCCGDFATPAASGEHVDLFVSSDLEMCAGQLAAYDRFVEAAQMAWRGTRSVDFRIQLHVGSDECGIELGGCAHGSFAGVRIPLTAYHEIAHNITIESDGYSNTFIGEGAAEALGSAFPALQPAPTPLNFDTQDVFFSAIGAPEAYRSGGAFVRFSLERYGTGPTREFYRAAGLLQSRRVSDPDAWRRAFFASTQDSIEDALIAFGQTERCTYDLWYCDAATPVSLPHHADAVDCDDPRALYFEDLSNDRSTAFKPLHLAKWTAVHMETLQARSKNLHVQLLSCGTCDEQQPTQEWYSWQAEPSIHEIVIEPGTIVFAIQPINLDSPIEWDVQILE